MTTNYTQIVIECNKLLERNLVSSAIRRLYEAYYGENILNNRDMILIQSRLLGHLGEYSEALRLLNEMRFEPHEDMTFITRATVWAGMYWSRLGESKKALNIFNSITPPEETEYLTYYLAHLLTIAIDLGDNSIGTKAIALMDNYEGTIKTNVSDWKELCIWRSILSPIIFKDLSIDSADNVKTNVNRLRAEVDKISFNSYIYLRMGNLYEHCSNYSLAKSYYEDARRSAIDGHNGVAHLMSNNALLDLIDNKYRNDKYKNERMQYLMESSVIAGQHGIGLIPCRLTKSLWNRVNRLGTNMKEECISWILSERYLPDIGRLRGNAFEQICAQILTLYADDIIGVTVNVDFADEDQKTYDLILTKPEIKVPLRMAVQCKGGSSIRKWSEKALMKELHTEKVFEERLSILKLEGFGGYIFMCSGRMKDDGRRWLNRIHKNIWKMDCIVIDAMRIEKYLIESPRLRTAVSLAISHIKE